MTKKPEHIDPDPLVKPGVPSIATSVREKQKFVEDLPLPIPGNGPKNQSRSRR